MPSLDHVNILTRDAAAMIDFLEAILGAREGFRPPFDVPGHWLYLDGHPAIHLNVVDRDDNFPTGMLNHVAFAFYDRDDVLDTVKASGFPFQLASIPGAGIGQIYVEGPEGITIELQYRE